MKTLLFTLDVRETNGVHEKLLGFQDTVHQDQQYFIISKGLLKSGIT
jgi:hypothetical protein